MSLDPKRSRKPKNLQPWDLITDALVDIVDGFKLQRTSRDYFNVCYFGTEKELRRACQRILNVLDSMERERANGNLTEDGRSEVYSRITGNRSGNHD